MAAPLTFGAVFFYKADIYAVKAADAETAGKVQEALLRSLSASDDYRKIMEKDAATLADGGYYIMSREALDAEHLRREAEMRVATEALTAANSALSDLKPFATWQKVEARASMYGAAIACRP